MLTQQTQYNMHVNTTNAKYDICKRNKPIINNKHVNTTNAKYDVC